MSFSLHSDIEHHSVAAVYLKLFREWKVNGTLPDVFGNEGQWEDSPSLCDSLVYKIHIKMPWEKPWKAKTPQLDRKSDSYLVYVRHWLNTDSYQIISVMSPLAHDMARTSFTSVLIERAESFHNS
ncbi:type II toxin-antitoxin system YafO family toxin [Salmonella enterica subsp. enterica]|nr:type II toxin-antitoxin system YafO family toxin [Salmonella enterica subsp. enterica]ECC8734474.1 type II toxin-antitoxin system YafO family toxin [Salmonella bongori]ECN8820289.1 type II toxin-antitoxin system YafO family toxin [Salmonella enterica subsp. enterica serovar Newport]